MPNFTGHKMLCFTTVAVNATNVYFYHALENGWLPSGRIIRCGNVLVNF